MATWTSLVSSIPVGTATVEVVGPKSMVHGTVSALVSAMVTVIALLPVTATDSGSLGHVLLPNVTTSSWPAPPQVT